MTTFTFTVPAAPLKAAVICSGYQDIRKYLVGVAIDRGHIVATDGNRLFYCSVVGLDEELPSIILPRKSVEDFFKKAKLKVPLDHTVLIEHDCKTCTMTIEGTDISETCMLIDMRYPEWKRVIPKTESWNHRQDMPVFNWDYLADFQKMAKIMSPKKSFPAVKLSPVQLEPPVAHIDFVYDYGHKFKARGVLMGIKL